MVVITVNHLCMHVDVYTVIFKHAHPLILAKKFINLDFFFNIQVTVKTVFSITFFFISSEEFPEVVQTVFFKSKHFFSHQIFI